MSFTINGFLAGLVAVTCPCYWVSPTGAILLGGVAGVLVVAGVELLEWLRIDDHARESFTVWISMSMAFLRIRST